MREEKRLERILTEKLIMLLGNTNAKEICLTVHPDNASAIKIYKDLGFEVLLESDNYYLDEELRLVMKRKAVANIINS